MVSRILKGAAVMLASTAFASTASAGCGGSTYCSSSNGYLPKLSSWTADSGATHSYESAQGGTFTSASTSNYGAVTLPSTYSQGYSAVTLPGTYSSTTSYTSSGSYGSGSYGSGSYGGMMSDSEASMKYGSGSISSAYEGGDVQMYGFSGSTSSLSGLGYGESLRATNCPTNVYNPNGGRVLGCYNVVKPVPQTNYVRVVRPIVYVRYPVPVAVPYWSGCTVVTHASRYGGRGWNQGLGYGHGRRCG